MPPPFDGPPRSSNFFPFGPLTTTNECCWSSRTGLNLSWIEHWPPESLKFGRFTTWLLSEMDAGHAAGLIGNWLSKSIEVVTIFARHELLRTFPDTFTEVETKRDIYSTEDGSIGSQRHKFLNGPCGTSCTRSASFHSLCDGNLLPAIVASTMGVSPLQESKPLTSCQI